MATIRVGDTLEGRYLLEAPIARGGMSTVYRGVDTRLGRHVAVKVMDSKFVGDPIFGQRFRREAMSMAKLIHPNIVGVYDYSSDGDHDWLVMELITGGTLRELLAERGPMPPHAATAVMRPVLAGLSAAHAKGLVHRDIKPDNVLINGDNQVKIADFGLVRAASATQATSNQIVGTVSYLSPEQVTGEDITPASDVYSAGILLFELLTGTRPFEGETQLAHAYARLDRDVPAPSTRINGVPKLFDELVATATARNPEERFQDAGEFLFSLDDVARELTLPHFTVPVPENAAAGAASAGISDQLLHTDMFTTDIESPQAATPPAADTRVLDEGLPSLKDRREATPPPGAPAPETRQFAPPPAQVPAGPPPPPQPAPQAPAQPRPVPVPPRTPPQVSNRSKAGFIAWLITVLLFTVTVAVGAWWFGSGRYGEVPQVLGMDEIQAAAVMQEAGFSTTTSPVYSNDVAANQSVGTDPAFGEKAVKGENITLLVSLGKPQVPDVPAAATMEAMTAALKERTLIAQAGEQEFSDTVPEGQVVRTTPPAGSVVDVGSTVVVHTSKGAAPVNVPQLAGKTTKRATQDLEALGLKVKVVNEFSPEQESGEVFATEPAAGASVTRGTTITLKVSTAIKIPDLVGKSDTEARRIIAREGLTVGSVTRSTTASAKDKDDVVDTIPEAGTLVDPATQKDITLVLAGEVDLPYVVGKSFTEARQLIRNAGFDYEVVSGTISSDAVVLWQSPTLGNLEPGETIRLRLIG